MNYLFNIKIKNVFIKYAIDVWPDNNNPLIARRGKRATPWLL